MIFTTGIGTYASQSKVSKEFKRILRENGLPDIRFHGLRHTSISLLLDMGTPVNTVQHRAGNSKVSVTTDIYGHVKAHSQDAAAENIEQVDISAIYRAAEVQYNKNTNNQVELLENWQ
jgi:integrase